MGISVVSIIGYALACPLALVGIAFWRRNRGLEASLFRSEQLFQKRTKELERVQKEWEEALTLEKGKQQKVGSSEKQLKELKTKNQDLLEQQLKTKEAHEKECAAVQEKLAEQVHQVEVLTAQLKEQDQSHRHTYRRVGELERELAQQTQRMDEKVQESQKAQFQELNRLRVENKKLESLMLKSQKVLEATDPEGDKRTKKQLAQYRHFYQTACNQRDMLEERMQNWETAIKIMATAICTQKGLTVPSSIGPLVGLALEQLNQGQLVNENEDDKEIVIADEMISNDTASPSA